ncbi:hypothetical protein [Bradyrhizobium sp. DASA03120]|uniref:hypothetical protein n=1 Tax=Bradyrhizobium sp. SMVTL-02 TaxID=3395917 RepID=UPI003F718E1E
MSKAKRMARSLDGVCGVDYGFAFKDGMRTDRLSVRFHMNRKQRLSRLPVDQRLPNKIDGIDLDVLEIGYSPHAGTPRAPQRLVQPGLSVGNLKQRSTGTLGALVRDLTTQERYLLSNWHVLCGGPEASVGDPISQPGPMDLGSSPPNEVANLERWLRLSEQFDAALGRLTDEMDLSEQLFGTAVVPTATVAPALGMSAIKSGAVSGVSQALIDGVAGTYRIDYTGFGDGPEWMQGFRLVPDKTAPAAALSLEGDSGSLWVERSTSRAVGLHFAGEDDVSPLNDYALAHAIDDVFMRLNVGLIVP